MNRYEHENFIPQIKEATLLLLFCTLGTQPTSVNPPLLACSWWVFLMSNIMILYLVDNSNNYHINVILDFITFFIINHVLYIYQVYINSGLSWKFHKHFPCQLHITQNLWNIFLVDYYFLFSQNLTEFYC
jgi:hypothetical protein